MCSPHTQIAPQLSTLQHLDQTTYAAEWGVRMDCIIADCKWVNHNFECYIQIEKKNPCKDSNYSLRSLCHQLLLCRTPGASHAGVADPRSGWSQSWTYTSLCKFMLIWEDGLVPVNRLGFSGCHWQWTYPLPITILLTLSPPHSIQPLQFSSSPPSIYGLTCCLCQCNAYSSSRNDL